MACQRHALQANRSEISRVAKIAALPADEADALVVTAASSAVRYCRPARTKCTARRAFPMYGQQLHRQ